MEELIHFFIESASRSGEALFGMVCALLIVLSLACYTGYQILDLIFGWLKKIKPIQIRRVEKVEKIVEVPKYVENTNEYKEILRRLERIEKDQNNELLP